MVKALLVIRCKQMYRGLLDIGLLRLVFLLGLVAFLTTALYIQTVDHAISLYVSIGLIFVTLLIHLKRADKLFLKSHFANFKTIMLTEYIVLSTPLQVCLLIHKQWSALLPLLALLVVVHLDYKPRYSSLNTRLQSGVPSDAIEWKAGLRQWFFLLIPIWAIAAITSFFIGSVPMAIFAIGLTTLSFYEVCEPVPQLVSYELGAKALLWLKVKRQLQLFTIAVVPLIALFLIFHNDKWYIPLAEYGAFCCLHVFVIMTKYAFFYPNSKSTSAQVFVSLGTLGTLIPVFLPAVWVFTIWFYIKSVKNLNPYLHDYDK